MIKFSNDINFEVIQVKDNYEYIVRVENKGYVVQLDYMDYIRMEKGFSELFVIADLLLDLSDMYYSDDYDDYLESISGKDSNTMRKTHKQLVKHKHQLLGIMSEEDIQLCVREAAEFF